MRKTFGGRRRPAARALALMLSLSLLAPSLPLAQSSARPGADPGAPTAEGMPMTLKEAVALALDNSLAIAVRRYDPHIADNNLLSEQGAFDPTLRGSVQFDDRSDPASDFVRSIRGLDVFESESRVASATYEDPFKWGGALTVQIDANRSTNNFRDPVTDLTTRFDATAGVTYAQSLLRNFGYDVNTTGIRVARRNQEISRSQFRQVVIDTIAGVEKAYWDLKFALEDLEVKRHSLRLSEETLSQNKIRVDVGTMAPIDVTTAEAEVASRRQDVLLAENALENSRDRLLLYLNQPKTSPLWVLPINPVDQLPFDENMRIDLPAALEEAYANRPDLEQTQKLIANDEDLVARARDQMRWDLVGSASYGRAGQVGRREGGFVGPIFFPSRNDDVYAAFEEIYDEDFRNWGLSLNLVVPLGNKQAKAGYLNARLVQQQRQEIFDSQELDAVIQVRNAARQVENTVERVKAARVNVRLQRERLAAENKRYENGMTTTFDLFQFQDDLPRAESQVILALVDFNKSLADLEAAKGTLATARGVVVAELVERGVELPELP